MKTPKYSLIVEWSDEDNAWVGRCPELIYGGVHGDDQQAVFNELMEAVDEAVAIFREDGRKLPEPSLSKKFSGKLVVRMEPDLHRQLAIEAMTESKSLNTFIVEKLKNSRAQEDDAFLREMGAIVLKTIARNPEIEQRLAGGRILSEKLERLLNTIEAGAPMAAMVPVKSGKGDGVVRARSGGGVTIERKRSGDVHVELRENANTIREIAERTPTKRLQKR